MKVSTNKLFICCDFFQQTSSMSQDNQGKTWDVLGNTGPLETPMKCSVDCKILNPCVWLGGGSRGLDPPAKPEMTHEICTNVVRNALGTFGIEMLFTKYVVSYYLFIYY